jgi:hypothetical protein
MPMSVAGPRSDVSKLMRRSMSRSFAFGRGSWASDRIADSSLPGSEILD